jgi:hypothetical protein
LEAARRRGIAKRALLRLVGILSAKKALLYYDTERYAISNRCIAVFFLPFVR